ncbi:MAG TPA: SCO family protein [Gallionella sp.]|nr:SCO family protein [Gallionella sp.]
MKHGSNCTFAPAAKKKIREIMMRYQELLLVLLMLSAGSTLAPRESQAYVAAIHHHHQPVPHNGYTRSTAAYRIPDVKLIDANGAEVSLHDRLDGAPVILNFFFTSCTVNCPVMTAAFSEAQKKLRQDGTTVHMVSISIDPEHDSPAMLKKYAAKFGVGPSWSILTGTRDNSIALQRAFNAYRGDGMSHQPVTFLRSGRDQPWVRIDGFISADDLLNEYRKLVSS